MKKSSIRFLTKLFLNNYMQLLDIFFRQDEKSFVSLPMKITTDKTADENSIDVCFNSCVAMLADVPGS